LETRTTIQDHETAKHTIYSKSDFGLSRNFVEFSDEMKERARKNDFIIVDEELILIMNKKTKVTADIVNHASTTTTNKKIGPKIQVKNQKLESQDFSERSEPGV